MLENKNLAIGAAVVVGLVLLFVLFSNKGDEQYSKATDAYLKKYSQQPFFGVRGSVNGVWNIPISAGVVTTPERAAQRSMPNPVRFNILEPMEVTPSSDEMADDTSLTVVQNPVLGASVYDRALDLDLPPITADSYSSRAERDLDTNTMANLLTGTLSGFANPMNYAGIPDRGSRFSYRARAGTGHPLETDDRMGQLAFLENEALVVTPTPGGYAGPTAVEKDCHRSQPCFGYLMLGRKDPFVAGGGAEWNLADEGRKNEILDWHRRQIMEGMSEGFTHSLGDIDREADMRRSVALSSGLAGFTHSLGSGDREVGLRRSVARSYEGLFGAPPAEAATYACRTGLHDAMLSSQESGVKEIEICPQRVGTMPAGANLTAQRTMQTDEHRRRW